MSNKETIKVFEDRTIRSLWDDDTEEWYFSIVDVVAVLTDSVNPTAYWRKLKERLKKEGNQSVTDCHAFKMQAADGKMRKTDCAHTEQLFRLIQSIPSPKAEPTVRRMAMNNLMEKEPRIDTNAHQLKSIRENSCSFVVKKCGATA